MAKILILYHYYAPDDVVSAQEFSGLAEGLAAKGFEVEAWPSNRDCHNPDKSYPLKREEVKGVRVRRVWRPNFRQHSFLGRILNSIWMQKAWFLRLLFTPRYKPDLILTGTDPLFSVLVLPFLKFLRPKAKIAQWCFDLYPEAAIADGIVGRNFFLVKLLRYFIEKSYKACEVVADIGPCMRVRLQRYGIKKSVTLTPWALEESDQALPFDTKERVELFGDSPFGLLYSGSFGRAHEFELTLALARKTRNHLMFGYSARGSRLDELKQQITPEDTNIRFVDFAPADRLAARLSAPDVHVVSLRPEWAGIVVPSKFFGALAAGRPVLFEGSEFSSIAKWIVEFKVGWVLKRGTDSSVESARAGVAAQLEVERRPDNLEEVAADLMRFSSDPIRKAEMFKHCHEVYAQHFSRVAVISRWDKELRRLLE